VAAPLHAQEWVAPSEIASGQDLLYRGRFSAAHLYFVRLAESRPRDPVGPTLAASALIWWGNAREEDRFLSDSIETLLAEGLARATREASEAADDSSRAAAYFWVGTAYAYRARQADLQGKWWRAVRDAGHMRTALERARALDSTCADCLLGLAVYEYGLARAGALARLVARLVGLGRGDVDHAMELFRRVVAQGTVTRTEARWVYASALAREGVRDPSLREEALRMVADLVAEYPDNPVFLRFLGKPPTTS
jgi:tetratricopeptide (TPR) repeat protein